MLWDEIAVTDDASAGSDFGGGDAHRVFTAAQNCSVTAVVSSVTFQPFVSAFASPMPYRRKLLISETLPSR